MLVAVRTALRQSRRALPASSPPLCSPSLPRFVPSELLPSSGSRTLHQSAFPGAARQEASEPVVARMVEKRKQERKENTVMLSMLAIGLSISGYYYYTSQIRPYSQSSPVVAFPVTPATRLPPAPGPQAEQAEGGNK